MKTAVEWLKEIYDSCNTYEKFISNSDWEQANKMFEEQIIKAYANAVMKENNSDYIGMHEEISGEKYYKETFKSE